MAESVACDADAAVRFVLTSSPTVIPPADWVKPTVAADAAVSILAAAASQQGDIPSGRPPLPSSIVRATATADPSLEQASEDTLANPAQSSKAPGAAKENIGKEDVVAAGGKLTSHLMQIDAQSVLRPEEFFFADNSCLKAKTAGLGLRNSMSHSDMDKDRCLVPWGSLVSGLSVDANWVKVGEHFLPKRLQGVPVLFPVSEDREDTSLACEDISLGPYGYSPCSSATTVPEGNRHLRFNTPDAKMDRFAWNGSSTTLQKEVEELKEELQVARARLARLSETTDGGDEAQELVSEAVADIRDQTIERLQKKLLQERQQAEASRQELMREFEREREALKHELCLERARRQSLQLLYEARIATDAETTRSLPSLQLPSERQDGISPTPPTAAPQVHVQTAAQQGVCSIIHRVAPIISSPARQESRPHRSRVEAFLPAQVRSASPASVKRHLSGVASVTGSPRSRAATPGAEVRLRSQSIGSRSPASSMPLRVLAAPPSPLPQPRLVQPSTIVYKPVIASSATTTRSTRAPFGETAKAFHTNVNIWDSEPLTPL